nr:hypothetical protein [Micromonospora sp. DSM 115978]
MLASPQTAAGTVAGRYARALHLGVVGILLIWHFGYDVLILSRGWSAYLSHPAVAVAWLLIAVVQVIGSILLLRGRAASAGRARALAATALAAGVLATISYPPGQVLSDVSWAWNTVGWCGVLLLMHRPLRELIVMLTANCLVTVVALALDGDLDRVQTGRFLAVLYATAGTQMLFAVVGHRLHRVAGRVTKVTMARAERRSLAATNEAIHTGRRRRYREVRERIQPLLRGLADRTLDPNDPEVRRAAGVEAARLRRLFAETDDTPDPLLHELRACADLAERRGLDLTFVHYGDLPEVPVSTRRFLTDVVLLVLAAAEGRARITTVAQPTGVVVSVLADAPADALAGLREILPVSVFHDQQANQLWVEVQWRQMSAPSESASSMTTRWSSRGSAPG